MFAAAEIFHHLLDYSVNHKHKIEIFFSRAFEIFMNLVWENIFDGA